MQPARSAVLLGVLAALSLGLVAANRSVRPAERPPELHQFDFWLGDWDVRTADGRLQCSSRIVRVADGHGVLEERKSAFGTDRSMASSLNAWNSRTQQWRQLWTRADGAVLELSGGLDDAGRMVLSGEQGQAGARLLNRITWTPRSNETVRRVWEQSVDDGKLWRLVLDERYERRKTKLASGGANHSRALLYLLQ